MCPLCLTSLAIVAAKTTGAGATAIAVAARVAKSLTRSGSERNPESQNATPHLATRGEPSP